MPSELFTAKVDVRATATVVEVWRERVRITSHERSYGPKGTAVTKQEHRPRAHREWGNWPPERLVSWAQTKGPKTALPEEVETRPVVHENIRGGEYFDRNEVNTSASTSDRDEIEARYLEEERLSIIHEQSIESTSGQTRPTCRMKERSNVSSSAIDGCESSSSDVTTQQPLPVLFERLQTLWTRTPGSRWGLRGATMDLRGGGRAPRR